MFRSDAAMRTLLRMLTICLPFAACSEIEPITFRGLDTLVVLGVLEADLAEQQILIARASAGEEIEGLRAIVRDGSGAVVLDSAVPAFSFDALRPCQLRYGNIVTNGTPRCASLDWQPNAGASYTITLVADNAPAVTATVDVPTEPVVTALEGEFTGATPSSIDATWTRSEHAHRYYLMLRPAELPECFQRLECRDAGWTEQTADTSVAAAIDRTQLHDARGPWTLVLLAVPEELHRYINSGSSEDLFPVSPADNIDGGSGVLGAWARVELPLE